MFQRFSAMRRDGRGATSIEYALIAGFISLLIVAGATTIGTNLSTRFYAPVTGGFN